VKMSCGWRGLGACREQRARLLRAVARVVRVLSRAGILGCSILMCELYVAAINCWTDG